MLLLSNVIVTENDEYVNHQGIKEIIGRANQVGMEG